MALPSRTFTGAQGTTSKDTRGPEQLIIDLDNLFAMFDPNGVLHDGSAGGVPAASSQLITPDPAVNPTGFAGNGNVLTLLSHVARLLLAITGSANWYTVPVSNIYDLAHATYYVHPNHSGDVVSAGDGAQTIAAKAVSLSKMADVGDGTVFFRPAGIGPGVPTVSSLTTLKTALGLMQASDITDQKTGTQVKVSVCTQGEYDALGAGVDPATLYFIKGA